MNRRFAGAVALGLLLSAAEARAFVRPGPQRNPTAPAEPLRFDRHWLEPYFASGPAAAAAERFRREDWRGAVVKLGEAARGMPVGSSERAAARYLEALAHTELGEWSAARDLFEQLYQSYPVLAPYHALEAARCRLQLGDTAGALSWIAKVPPATVPEAEAMLLKMQALADSRQWEEVEQTASQYLERFPAGGRRAEAMFRMAEAMENRNRDVGKIAALYRRIWAEAPLEIWSRRAEERLAVLASQAAAAPARKMPGLPSPGDLRRFQAADWLTRGMVFFERNQNERAESAFAAALEEAKVALPGGPASAELRCQAEFHRAQSMFKARQRTRAAPAFLQAEAACKEAGNKDLLTKARYQGARCLATAGEREAALARYEAIQKDAPDHSYADDARLRAAELYTESEELDKAAALLADLPDRFPGGDMVGEALWRLALAAIRQGRWEEAHRWLDENLRRVPREDVWYAEGRALYWKGRVFIKQGNPKDGLAYLSRAIREYPLSVYALLAFERMRTEFPGPRAMLLRELHNQLVATPTSLSFGPRPAYRTPEFRRAVELARMGLGADARRELGRIGFSAPASRDAARANGPVDDEQEDVYLVTAMLLDRGRSWSAAHAIPRYSLTGYRTGYPGGRQATLWRLAYPRAFPELIGPSCRSNKVPEALQLAIMREESSFNPRIESVANALGLTQMLVKTAARFSERSVSRETLLDPAKNVELGSRYLGFLLERYNGMAPLAIASYNGGEGAVDRWLRERGELELDEFLETIPYDETRNYTKRVLSSYLSYSWLYDPKRPVPELRFSLKPPRTERVGRPVGRNAKSRPR